MILFKTIHGSHLYGLSTPSSDTDYYVVVSGKNRNLNRQTIVDGIDTNVVCFDSFLRLATKGVPQALEAMFSREPEIDHIGFLRSSFFATGPTVRDTYRRTIKNFWKGTDLKRKRHALRLCLNYSQLQRTGQFNPRLSENEIHLISDLCRQDGGLDVLRGRLI